MTKMPPIAANKKSPDAPPSKKELKKTNDPKPPARENFAEQGRQGNIKQNTTNDGYQQDR